MKKFILFIISLGLLSVGSSQAFDKEKFKTHFRKEFSLDSKMQIEVGESTPSSFGNLLVFPVTIQGQQQMVYMTKDERNYFWGMVYDMTVDPDKIRAGKLNLENVHIKGPKEAAVTIVEFSDIQCPNCQKAHELVDAQLFKDFPDGNVRLIFKHFPLTNHDWAEPAAVATECAGRESEENFWKMTDQLYKKASEITQANVKDKISKLAGELKLDKKKFPACLDDPSMVEKVRKDKQEGMGAGVNATPTFFVNGRMIRGNRYDDLKAVIQEKLAEVQKK